jgi:hypothetical protein
MMLQVIGVDYLYYDNDEREQREDNGNALVFPRSNVMLINSLGMPPRIIVAVASTVGRMTHGGQYHMLYLETPW